METFYEQFKCDLVFMGTVCDLRPFHLKNVQALSKTGGQFISITLGGPYMSSIFPLLEDENNRVKELHLDNLDSNDRIMLNKALLSPHCKLERLTIKGRLIPPYIAEPFTFKGVARKWNYMKPTPAVRFPKVHAQLYTTLRLPTNSVTHLTLGHLSGRDATELCSTLKQCKVEYLHVLNDVPLHTLNQLVDGILSELTKIKTLVLFLRFFNQIVNPQFLELISEGRTTLRNLKICGLYFNEVSRDAVWVATQSKDCTLLNFDMSHWSTEMSIEFKTRQATRNLFFTMLSAQVPRLKAPIRALPRDMYSELNKFL